MMLDDNRLRAMGWEAVHPDEAWYLAPNTAVKYLSDVQGFCLRPLRHGDRGRVVKMIGKRLSDMLHKPIYAYYVTFPQIDAESPYALFHTEIEPLD